jgi:hypothetical protein
VPTGGRNPAQFRESLKKALVSARPVRHHVNAVPDDKTEGGARMLMTNPLLIDRFAGAPGSFVVGTCRTA